MRIWMECIRGGYVLIDLMSHQCGGDLEEEKSKRVYWK